MYCVDNIVRHDSQLRKPRVSTSPSTGSACSAGVARPSHVLTAMGALTHGTLRVSLGRDTAEADVLREEVSVLREQLRALEERLEKKREK